MEELEKNINEKSIFRHFRNNKVEKPVFHQAVPNAQGYRIHIAQRCPENFSLIGAVSVEVWSLELRQEKAFEAYFLVNQEPLATFENGFSLN